MSYILLDSDVITSQGYFESIEYLISIVHMVMLFGCLPIFEYPSCILGYFPILGVLPS